MSQEYCKARGAMCDPRNCNREFCWWRDNVWAMKSLSKWAYDTDDKKPNRKNTPDVKPDTSQQDDE